MVSALLDPSNTTADSRYPAIGARCQRLFSDDYISRYIEQEIRRWCSPSDEEITCDDSRFYLKPLFAEYNFTRLYQSNFTLI